MSSTDRRAALEMHGLRREDREWILGQLDAKERRRIEPLLTELDAMDIRFDLAPGSLEHEQRDDDAPAAPPPAVAASSQLDAVRAAPPAAIIRALAQEPRWLVAAILDSEQWPWAQPVRAALGVVLEPTASQNESLSKAPALRAAAIELLAQHLQAPATAGSASLNGYMNGRINGHAAGGGHRLGRLWSGVKQWLP